MNKLLIKLSIVLLAVIVIFPQSISAQEKKEKTIKIKAVKEVDGKEVVMDTVFTITGDEDEKEMIKNISWTHDGDSSKVLFIDATIDGDYDKDHKMIFYSKDGNKFIHSGDDLKHGIKVITDEDGGENVYVFKHGEEDAVFEYKIQMDKLKDELEDIKIDIDAEKIILLEELEDIKELKELEGLAALEELKELKNIHVEIPDFHWNSDEDVHFYKHLPEHHDFFVYRDFHGHNATEKELRDAGIKVKQNRLEMEEFDLDIHDGIVDIEFSFKGEGSPKVEVFNFYGDKVTSGKPELLSGKYGMKIDLSTKQHGTYYLQVTVKDSSITKKLKL